MGKEPPLKFGQSSQTEPPSVELRPVSPVLPEDIRTLLGKRPIVTGEEPERYDDLLARIGNAIKPKNAIEWLWVKDVTDFTWEIQRYRRFKTALLDTIRNKVLVDTLAPICSNLAPSNWRPHDYARELARAWATSDPEARGTVDELFRENAIDIDMIMANALVLKIEDFERIERLIANAEARRDRLLRDIEARRASQARQHPMLPLHSRREREGMPIPNEIDVHEDLE